MHSAGVSKVLDSLTASLRARYADTLEQGVLNATKIANISMWPVDLEAGMILCETYSDKSDNTPELIFFSLVCSKL